MKHLLAALGVLDIPSLNSAVMRGLRIISAITYTKAIKRVCARRFFMVGVKRRYQTGYPFCLSPLSRAAGGKLTPPNGLSEDLTVMARMVNYNPYNKSSYPVGMTLPQPPQSRFSTPPSFGAYEIPYPSIGLPVPLMKMMLKGKSGIPKTGAKAGFQNVVTKGLFNLESPVSSQGMKGDPDTGLFFSNMTKFTCATNNPPTSGWKSWRVLNAPSCGVGSSVNPVGDPVGSGITSLTGALNYVNFPTPATNVSLWQLNGQSGLGGGRRRKYEYRRSGATRTVAVQAATVQEVGQPSVAVGPASGWQSASRTRLRPAVKPYEKPATELELGDDGSGGIVVTKPPVKTVHREVPTRTEKKTKSKLGVALIGAYHKLTEINDLFDSLADAIPGKPCSALPGFSKMLCVVNHWDEIDPVIAAKNIAMNEIEDKLVAKFQGQLGKLTQAGGPSTTQINQFLRQLSGLL